MRVASPPQPVISQTPTTTASQPTAQATLPLAQTAEKKLVNLIPRDTFQAPSADKNVRSTQSQQLGQISDGMRDGKISAGESEKLLGEQQGISDATKKAMADGTLSGDERLRLNLMQTLADMNISDAGAKGVPDLAAAFSRDADPSRQADQIDKVAKGISNGNITNSEASKLLGKQGEISEARQPNDPFSGISPIIKKDPFVKKESSLDSKLDAADRDITRHSKPGTQLDLDKVFDLPRPPGAIVDTPLPLLNKPLIRQQPGAIVENRRPLDDSRPVGALMHNSLPELAPKLANDLKTSSADGNS
ncbi:hypothetical protein [Hyalangium versicolor]|uniref:hypothetical protein n=1 Tax=Hyalangium versicolor TaxID=2861190 RepID=UPI001CCB408B|nr:hypothetical protein [Hyalangium versicolor]